LKTSNVSAEDETATSEISIAPDGRIFVFGASHEILELLAALNRRDGALRQRLEHIRAARIVTEPPALPNCQAGPEAISHRHFLERRKSP